ncbi:MAG TPA: DUF2334 domain-containing protein [Gemmatimonadaceae bacterium]|nr:DUF2334 domain-containing protein [Gemmatimonadaceae bacterium]
MPHFLICIHDAAPAWERETRRMIRDLGPIVGRRLAFGVVPNWHGSWPLEEHREYCHWLQESSSTLLLHGHVHRRLRGSGPVSWLAERCDEMNGLDEGATRVLIGAGQRVFTEVFGAPARGFLAPGWQRGQLSELALRTLSLDHILGFFSLQSSTGHSIPLATFTWDCGRWGWLGHLGHAIGSFSRSLGRGVPSLAIHPRDLERGYWPQILRLTRDLIDAGYEPATPSALIGERDVEAAA